MYLANLYVRQIREDESEYQAVFGRRVFDTENLFDWSDSEIRFSSQLSSPYYQLAPIVKYRLTESKRSLNKAGYYRNLVTWQQEILYFSGLLAMKKSKPSDEVMQFLQESVETHFTALRGLPLGSKYFELMNPDFLLQISKIFLQYSPGEPVAAGQQNSPALKKCAAILEPVVKTVPGLLEGLYLMAKVKYIAGDVDGAKGTVHVCLEQDSTFVNAHLLMAQIHLYKGNYAACDQSLENGLSYNFEVRESPMYHLIKAKAMKKLGNLEECLKALQVAMNLPGVRKADKFAQLANEHGVRGTTKNVIVREFLESNVIDVSNFRGKHDKENPVFRRRIRRMLADPKQVAKFPVLLGDRVALYLELADTQRLLNQQHEAAKTMQDAIHEFQGTPEEVRISIANADLSLMRSDVEQALTILRQITAEQSYYVQAREKMADIYLNYRKDKRLYASVYRELVEKNPTPQTYLLLGDAYMGIQEPEKAIEVYETALKRNPRDGALASKIGQALIKTHQYGKAISYYEAAVKTGNQNFLRYDLAELYLKLKNYEKAEKVIKMAIQQDGSSTDLSSMIEETKCWLLLAKIYRKSRDTSEALEIFSKARDMQSRVLKRIGVEQPEALQEQKTLAAQISSDMAEHYAGSKDYDKAIKSYKEALFYNEADTSSMLALANLYLNTGDLDSCQHQLVTLLKNDKENDSATVMMADLMFRKNEYDAAIFHFQQLLERRPDHYDALAKLVDLMKRAGKLSECKTFINQAEKASVRASVEPGFNYCKALYEWYQNNATAALRHFNFARKDTIWGEKALYNMISICLNPDSEIVGAETFEAVDSDSSSAAEKQDSEQMALRTAEKLLKEVKPKSNPLKHKILENYALMATKNKSLTEKALASYMELATTERDYVPALLGMATAYMILKQTPRARNQLKRVGKMTWNSEDADDFEKCWLLLADIYIQNGKYDMAQELLKRCLQFNKSCCKAWEYMGFIMEKEQAYKDAAFNYENAWKYSNESNPAIGYKLAFNYLKAKRYVDAIDVCHKVLASQPNYPKIRKDILDKARLGIRN